MILLGLWDGLLDIIELLVGLLSHFLSQLLWIIAFMVY